MAYLESENDQFLAAGTSRPITAQITSRATWLTWLTWLTWPRNTIPLMPSASTFTRGHCVGDRPARRGPARGDVGDERRTGTLSRGQ